MLYLLLFASSFSSWFLAFSISVSPQLRHFLFLPIVSVHLPINILQYYWVYFIFPALFGHFFPERCFSLMEIFSHLLDIGYIGLEYIGYILWNRSLEFGAILRCRNRRVMLNCLLNINGQWRKMCVIFLGCLITTWEKKHFCWCVIWASIAAY